MAASRRTFLKAAIAAGAGLSVAGAQEAKAFDAIVVGAGAIGSTTAYFLAREGLKVALLDKGVAGREASWASAGMIQPYGSVKSEAWPTRATLLSRALYDELEPRLFEETGKRIGYGGEGGLILAFDDAEAERVAGAVRALADQDSPARLLKGDDLRTREPGLADGVVAAALLPAHRYLDARTYTSVVIDAARKKGVTLLENTPATGVLLEGKKLEGVTTAAGKLVARTVINCAGAWAGAVEPKLPLPLHPIHGQILSVEGPKPGLRHNLQRISGGGYATPRTDGRVVVGATSEDFGYEKKMTPAGLRALAAMVRELVPHLSDRKVLDTWSGLRPGSPDGLPAVGPDPRVEGRLFWAAGHGGYGMMQCPATAAVISDLVLGRPARIPIDSVRPARLIE